MMLKRICFTIALACLATTAAQAEIKSLIIDGQNNHDWKATTPVLTQILEEAGFSVDVATSPQRGGDMSTFHPNFADFDVLVSNYNGDRWSKKTEQALIDYVKSGGGFVVVHAADNSFPDWNAYNEMIGLGGWGGRNEKSGPYVYFREGRVVRDTETKGSGGSHGPQHEFQIVIRDGNHPITDGMPPAWMHSKDELYDSLRGPGANMRILATAYSKKSGRHEPMMMTIRYGDGRVFHTPMGHADYSMKCAGFVSTLQRGTEWAATGKVTIPVVSDFPGPDKTSSRP